MNGVVRQRVAAAISPQRDRLVAAAALCAGRCGCEPDGGRQFTKRGWACAALECRCVSDVPRRVGAVQ